MHPVQAAPRQSSLPRRPTTAAPDAPRAGSAEAKSIAFCAWFSPLSMHPVQAAPRQSQLVLARRQRVPGCTPCRQRRGKAPGVGCRAGYRGDAPRAGSAEAKCVAMRTYRATLDAPRAGSAEAKGISDTASFHPRQDAPRAGSAEAKIGCKHALTLAGKMHPVQAAPRQRSASGALTSSSVRMHPVQAAPRQSFRTSPTKHSRARCTPCRQRRGKDSTPARTSAGYRCTPCRQRRGKVSGLPAARTEIPMHPVQAAPRQRLPHPRRDT